MYETKLRKPSSTLSAKAPLEESLRKVSSLIAIASHPETLTLRDSKTFRFLTQQFEELNYEILTHLGYSESYKERALSVSNSNNNNSNTNRKSNKKKPESFNKDKKKEGALVEKGDLVDCYKKATPSQIQTYNKILENKEFDRYKKLRGRVGMEIEEKEDSLDDEFYLGPEEEDPQLRLLPSKKSSKRKCRPKSKSNSKSVINQNQIDTDNEEEEEEKKGKRVCRKKLPLSETIIEHLFLHSTPLLFDSVNRKILPRDSQFLRLNLGLFLPSTMTQYGEADLVRIVEGGKPQGITLSVEDEENLFPFKGELAKVSSVEAFLSVFVTRLRIEAQAQRLRERTSLVWGKAKGSVSLELKFTAPELVYWKLSLPLSPFQLLLFCPSPSAFLNKEESLFLVRAFVVTSGTLKEMDCLKMHTKLKREEKRNCLEDLIQRFLEAVHPSSF